MPQKTLDKRSREEIKRDFFSRPRCHKFGSEFVVVYGQDEDDDREAWPSYSIWVVPGTMGDDP